MTIPQLKAELTKYKLPVSGKRKEELVQRLQIYSECQLTGPIDFDFIGRVCLTLFLGCNNFERILETNRIVNGC